MRYFNHDTNASSDELIIQLRLEHGAAAIDAYWAILEYLYGEEKPLPFGENQRETKSVLFRLCLGFSELEKYVKTMVEIGLLISRKSPSNEIEFISSLRANEAIEAYHAKAESARQNGKKGGRPPKPKQNPEKTQSVSSSVSEKNRSEKLTRTRRVGFDKQNLPLPADGAGGNNPAPPADDLNAIFDEVDERYAAMVAERQRQAELAANAVSCPPEILAGVKGGTA